MLSQLKSAGKVIGQKQTVKAIRENRAKTVYFAADADERIVKPVVELCREHKVETVEVATMKELGEACKIDVGAAVAATLI